MSLYRISSNDCEMLYTNALLAKFGLKLELEDYELAFQWRRRLYNWRERQRRKGIGLYDGISLVLYPDGTLKLVQREAIPNQTIKLPEIALHELESNEIPSAVYARGPSKSTAIKELMGQI